ncbi:cation:proton antiporter [Patescibacteria group bacterium]|nr:cation:proton antiporter [Patescibacteria group bacterium]
MNLSLLLSGVFLTTFVLGRLLEKIRIPWVFAALFLGLALSFNNPFAEITSTDTFDYMAQLGMYFLLFIIGFDINVGEILTQKKFITKLTFFIVFWEMLFGALVIHYVFDITWLISFVVAASFATVGEAVLVPILDEFKLMKTKFGQTILGVGTLDDVFELITVVIASSILGVSVGHSGFSLLAILLVLSFLFLIPLVLYLFREKINHFQFKGIPMLFLFSLFLMFLFVGLGEFAEASFLGALLSGMALRTFLKDKSIEQIEEVVRAISYGFFVPIFFLWIGLEVDVRYLLSAPLLILMIVAITKTTKILSTCIIARKEMSLKKSVLMGIGLSAKFSTSIVIVSMFYNNGLITLELFSVLVGATIASKFIIPILFSYLIQKWDLKFEKVRA